MITATRTQNSDGSSRNMPATGESLYYTGLQMGAVLLGTDGPSRGRIVPLGNGEVSLGREKTNTVPIDDVAASKQHCVVRRCGDQYKLIDRNSRNGTFVNGLMVREQILEDNDEIRVGGSVFLFQRDHKEDTQVVSIRSSDSIYLNLERLETVPLLDRTVYGVHVLLRISQALQKAQTVAALAHDLVQLLFEAVPAECGCIVLSNAPEAEPAFFLHRGLDGRPNTGEPPTLDPEISRQVLQEGRAILKRDGRPSTIAAPLIYFEKVIGMLYLRAGHERALFDNGDLELVSAVGSIAGLAIRNLRSLDELRQEKERLEQEIQIEHDMVGNSQAMRDMHRFISRVAPGESTVLIIGESGTGKELVARAIHRNSARADKPFVPINCAALTETLLESELFGHEKGSFTGAQTMKKGMFEVADGGTLFLDEIGELAPGLQAKLLRAIETKEFMRVGGTRPIRVDVRILAATNRNLEAAAAERTFRQDLYFRLNVISRTLPPLREHPEDIPALATHFLKKFSGSAKRNVQGISDKALSVLMKYDWEGGNVRELKNAIEYAVVLGASNSILPEDLPEAVLENVTSATPTDSGESYQDAVVAFKRAKVTEALRVARGVVTEAAKLLGVHPNYLHRLMKNLKVVRN